MPNLSENNEREEINSLIQKVKNGDEIAFETIVKLYDPLISSTVSHFLPSFGVYNGIRTNEASPEPDEVRQDCILALYKAASKYDVDEMGSKVTFGLFAKVCLNNAMVSKVRKYRRALKRLEGDDDYLTPAKKFYNEISSKVNDEKKLNEILVAVIQSLPEYERRVFGYFVEGRKNSDIASITDRDEKSVVNALYRVKTKIRKAADEMGMVEDSAVKSEN